ncbi:inhibitor of apoptosis-promoting Bax1-domain-containing protein [Sporodiniella umbellata]|nr:inhibitor of apoptosis-promoting Bax1-domain-containing protein [Sporodiniella umbellata]
MSYGTSAYSQPPPAYDEESAQPLMGNADDMYKETVANSSLEIRLQFVRKVYTILATQVLGTTALSALYMYNDSIKSWVQASQWLVIVSSLGAMGVLFALFWKSRSYPLNYGLLTLFTVLESHAVGTIVTFYSQTLVLKALLITLGVFIGLTLFTLQSKWDFSGLAPFLFAGVSILFVIGIIQMFFPFSKGFELAVAIGAVVIFSGYILFDTYLIFNKYSPEDYIIASVSLYIDIINLFLRILEILNLTGGDD